MLLKQWQFRENRFGSIFITLAMTGSWQITCEAYINVTFQGTIAHLVWDILHIGTYCSEERLFIK